MILQFVADDGSRLTIDGGRIVSDDQRPDEVVRVGAGLFMPGLINAHDHLHRNHYPRLGSPPYADVYAWGADIHARHAAEIARAKRLGRTEALLFGALKNILGGATTVVHHDAWEPDFTEIFPVRVVRLPTVHSLGNERDRAHQLLTSRKVVAIHLAEGTSERATQEVHEAARGALLHDRLLAVHVVGADAEGTGALYGARVALVWCPTSNQFLYGATAPRTLVRSGIDVLLGTDAMVSADGTILDELRAARARYYLDDERLLAAVGATAARRLGIAPPASAPGAAADVVFTRIPLLDARPKDVALVLVAGRLVLVDESITIPARLRAGMGRITVGGCGKLVPEEVAQAAERAVRLVPECGRILA